MHTLFHVIDPCLIFHCSLSSENASLIGIFPTHRPPDFAIGHCVSLPVLITRFNTVFHCIRASEWRVGALMAYCDSALQHFQDMKLPTTEAEKFVLLDRGAFQERGKTLVNTLLSTDGKGRAKEEQSQDFGSTISRQANARSDTQFLSTLR